MKIEKLNFDKTTFKELLLISMSLLIPKNYFRFFLVLYIPTYLDQFQE